jgi:cytochrome c553
VRSNLLGIVLTLAALTTPAFAQSPGQSTAGSAGMAQRLYRQGILPLGHVLRGARAGADSAEGATAACANCHRRSGLGGVEGLTIVPPIIGPYLFDSLEAIGQNLTMPHVSYFVPRHRPYDDATLARAIRDGIDPDGHALNYLMPRFALDDAAMTALIGYLRNLGTGAQPGVEPDTLHFATIITPDTDDAQRKAMLDVIKQFFLDHDRGGHFYFDGRYTDEPPAPRDPASARYNIERKWQLHIWQLAGPPDTWGQQLREKLAAEPVFAVVSGLAGSTWTPVHRFCEANALPCIFPNVDAPPAADQDFYPVYYSQGVFLEAKLMLRRIESEGSRSGVHRVVQVYRAGDAGEVAALALKEMLNRKGIPSVLRPIGAGGESSAEQVLPGAGDDAIALWLRPADLATLPNEPVHYRLVLASAQLGKLEHAALPAEWRKLVRIAYPFDLPEPRAVRLQLPLAWFKLRHLEVVDERLQANTYLACVILAATLDRMGDSFVRDYLNERLEDTIGQRSSNGYYPRLGLAPGQRFASKGGYIARFAGETLVADGPWMAP